MSVSYTHLDVYKRQQRHHDVSLLALWTVALGTPAAALGVAAPAGHRLTDLGRATH